MSSKHFSLFVKTFIFYLFLGLGHVLALADKSDADWNGILDQVEQANRELEQDSNIIKAKRLMDGELFIGCTSNGARDSLEFFLKKLDNLRKFNSSVSSKASYYAERNLYYYYAKNATRYALHLQLSSQELIKLYDRIEKLFCFPQDTVTSLCFNLEKTRLSTDRHLELGDYMSYELLTFVDKSHDLKSALLALFWPSAYFFGRFNSAPYLLQQIAENSLAEQDYKNAFYYVDRAIDWYRFYLRDYGGMHNLLRSTKIKEEAYEVEKSANGGNAGYAYLSTKADMSESAKNARKKSIPYFSLGAATDIVSAYFLRELALDYIAENDFDIGTYYLQQSINAFRENVSFLSDVDCSFLVHNYLVLSNAYEQIGNVDDAVKSLNSGIAAYDEMKLEKEGYAMSHLCMLLKLANIYFDADKTLSAFKVMHSFEDIWFDEGKIIFDFIPLIGISYSSRDQIIGALSTQYAYACARRQISKGNLSEASIILQKVIESLDKYRLQESILKPTFIACLANVLSLQNNIEEAQQCLSELLSSTGLDAPINLLVHAYIMSARLDLEKGYGTDALDKCSEALSLLRNYVTSTLLLLSESEREKFYGKIKNEFEDIISVCTSPQLISNPKSAVLIAEISLMSKGILLSSSNYLKYIISTSRDPNLKKLYDVIKEHRENEAVMGSQSLSVDRSSSELTRLEFELLNHPVIKASISDWSSIVSPSIDQIKSSLNDGEIAVDFVEVNTEVENHSLIESDQAYYAIVVDKVNQPAFVPIALGKDLSLELDNLVAATCDVVWKPLKEYIVNYHTVYFSPVGVLNNMPLENISDIIDTDDTRLMRISSLRELTFDRHHSSPHTAVLFGGINYNAGASEFKSLATDSSNKKRAFSFSEVSRAGISPLQHTLDEIKGIKQSLDDLGNNSISVILKSSDKATEQFLRSLDNSGLNILHFATHGFYYEDLYSQGFSNNMAVESSKLSSEDLAMNRTGLFLAGANANFKKLYLNPNDDGILSAREVSELYFPDLDLVVLSACKTGLGDIKEDGVYGLQRGFKKAGAKTILMSLWEVNDLATSILVQEFYKAWLSYGSQSRALGVAREKVRNFKDSSNDFSNPFYWAGFVLLDAVN